MKAKRDKRIDYESQDIVADALTSLASEKAYEAFIDKEDYNTLASLLVPKTNDYYSQEYGKITQGVSSALTGKNPNATLDALISSKTTEIINTIVTLKQTLAQTKTTELSGHKAIEALEKEAKILTNVKLLKSMLALKPMKSDQHALTITRAVLKKYSKENFSAETQTELFQETLERSRSARGNTNRLIRLNETGKDTVKASLNSYKNEAKAADATRQNETDPSLKALNYLKRLVANEGRAYAEEKFSQNPPNKRQKS